MEPNKFITVEVAYATVTRQCLITLAVPADTIVQSVILLSGMLAIFPDIDLTKHKVGIFSKPCRLTDIVKQGDRVEIYRPLTLDPKEIRKIKAKLAQKSHS